MRKIRVDFIHTTQPPNATSTHHQLWSRHPGLHQDTKAAHELQRRTTQALINCIIGDTTFIPKLKAFFKKKVKPNKV
jgi:hypothetical protein